MIYWLLLKYKHSYLEKKFLIRIILLKLKLSDLIMIKITSLIILSKDSIWTKIKDIMQDNKITRIISGTIAGWSVVTVGQPLDFIKTLYQVRSHHHQLPSIR